LLLRAYLRPRWSPLLPYTTLFRSSPRYQIHKTAGRRGTVRRAGTGGRCSKVLAEYNPRAPMAAPNLSADTPWLYRQGDLVLGPRSEEHTSELQSRENLVCRLLLEK